MIATRISDDIEIVATVKDRERYIVLYVAATRADCLRQLGRWASNPELSYTWYDAACASQKVRAGAVA